MAITITSPPPTLSLCRNDVWLEVACGKYRSGSTQLAVIFIEPVATPPPGHIIKMVLADATVLQFFAIAGVPDDSGTQYTIGGMDNLAAALNASPPFSALYRAQVADGGTTVAIGGRTPSIPMPQITFSGGFAYALGNGQHHIDYAYAPNYSVRSAVWIERQWMSNKWERLPMDEHHPASDLRVAMDLSRMLAPAIAYDWPAYGVSHPIRSLAPQRRYKVDIWERYGTPATDRILTSTPICFAWNAGQRQRDTASFASFSALLHNAQTPTPWLTFRGRAGRHEVSAAQQHVLGWIRNVPAATGLQFRLFATVTYSDGTTASTYAFSDGGMSWGQYEIGLWPCGFHTLSLQLLEPTKTPVKYAVKLMRQAAGAAAVQASEEHMFWLVPADASELHIEFVNSLGVVESMRCSGAWEEALDVKRASIFTKRSMINGQPPPTSVGNTRDILSAAGNTLQVCTGTADQAEHYALMDIFFSPEVRLVDTARKRKLPLLLQAGTPSVARRGAEELEHIYTIDLKFTAGDDEVAWGDKAALPVPPMGEIGGGFNTGE